MKNLNTLIALGLWTLSGSSLVSIQVAAAQRPISDFLSRQGKYCMRLAD